VSHTQLPSGPTCAVAVNTTNPLVSTANDGDPVCQ